MASIRCLDQLHTPSSACIVIQWSPSMASTCLDQLHTPSSASIVIKSESIDGMVPMIFRYIDAIDGLQLDYNHSNEARKFL